MARHGRHRRHRSRPTRVLGRSALLALVLVALATTAVLVSRGGPSLAGAGGTTSTQVDAAKTTPPSTTAPTSTTVPSRDPFSSPAVASYLSSREGTITAALYDVSTGQTYLYHPGTREVTASMVKIDILAALLAQAQTQNRSLSATEDAVARRMIIASGNGAASRLFDEVGQRDGLARFNQSIGFTQTVPSWGWGLTATTPVDQLALLKTIVLPGGVLSPASQAYEQSLMEHVYDSERFGIATGPPASARVGVKDGWYDEASTGWQINSAGYVQLGTVDYLAVVETAGDPSEDYGKATVSQLGELLWSYQSQP